MKCYFLARNNGQWTAGRNPSWKEVNKAIYIAWSKTFISIAFIGVESSSSMGTIRIVPTLYVIRFRGNNTGELHLSSRRGKCRSENENEAHIGTTTLKRKRKRIQHSTLISLILLPGYDPVSADNAGLSNYLYFIKIATSSTSEMAPRSSHKKSRNGCHQCKQRRVKVR